MDKLKLKFRGALLGTGLGDSLGRSLEGGSMIDREEVEKLLSDSDELRYTDDTQQMMSLAESLAERRDFDAEYFSKRLVENFEVSRGYGPGSTRVIRSIAEGEDWYKPAKRLFNGEGSYGNGSSMRVAPAGLFSHDSLNHLPALAERTSQVTHTHRLAVQGAILQSYAVALATRTDVSDLERKSFLKEVRRCIREEEYEDKIDTIDELLDSDQDKAEVVNSLGNGVEAVNSVPTALYSFLSHPNSFEEAVIYAISLGGDTDTIGAMTGAIAGAYHGSDRIPEDWKKILEDRVKIVRLADELYNSL